MNPQYALLAIGWDGIVEEATYDCRLDAMEAREWIRPDYAGVKIVERLVRDDGSIREVALL